MYNLVVILILVVCVLLAGVVLIQNSKGGGLAANYGGANQVMGVRKTTETIEKATWILAAVLMVLSIFATALIRSVHPHAEGELKTEVVATDINAASLPANTVAAPAQEAAPAAE